MEKIDIPTIFFYVSFLTVIMRGVKRFLEGVHTYIHIHVHLYCAKIISK